MAGYIFKQNHLGLQRLTKGKKRGNIFLYHSSSMECLPKKMATCGHQQVDPIESYSSIASRLEYDELMEHDSNIFPLLDLRRIASSEPLCFLRSHALESKTQTKAE